MLATFPSHGVVTKCVVTKGTVERNLKPTLVIDGAMSTPSRAWTSEPG
jgi:hypothetical protein